MKYLVTGNIKHDGKPLKVGSVAEFDTEEGDRLMAGGYLAGVSAELREAAAKAVDDNGNTAVTKTATPAKTAAPAKTADGKKS
jgi:hypothetical protein